MDQGEFTEYPNSFFNTVFALGERPDINEPPSSLLQNLSSISALYIYSNPPPMGYGTPAPKVAETVLRAYGMNKNPEGLRTIEIDGFIIQDPVWHGKQEDFPWFEPASNFDAAFVHEAAIAMMESHGKTIIRIVNDVITECSTLNSDVLTKGRQTYCPLTQSSLSCPRAYKNMVEFLQANGAPATMTILTLISEFFNLLNRTELKAPITTSFYRMKYTRGSRGSKQVKVKRRKTKWVVLKGDEKYKYLLGLARSFCTYIKHGERSHLERRAIASPNIIKRAFLFVIEEVHLRLGKELPGSTISIGGEEKKNKIISTVESLLVDEGKLIRKQGTEDATKWNETLSAALFGMVQSTFMDPAVRRQCGLRPPTIYEKIYERLFLSSHFLLAIKRVTMGPGLQGYTHEFHGEIPFTADGLAKMNSRTQEWFSQILPLIEDEIYIYASPGMLMGMHNALSTTVGLVPVNYLHPGNSLMKVLRSSDDSMSMHAGADEEEVLQSVDLQYFELKLSAIAMSPKKTLLFGERFGEYTSWFQDGKLVSQYGPETTTLRPIGRNPYDDYYAAAKSTSVSLLNCSSNPFGAEVKLTLSLHNICNLYRIKRVPITDSPGPTVRVIADGGSNVWDISNCHLDESVIKENLAGPTHAGYFLKIRNPLNPFSRTVEEQTYYDRDLGMLTTDTLDIPATIFSYVKRANRAVTCKEGIPNAKTEEEAQAVLNVINQLDYSTAIQTPREATLSGDFCATNLMMLRGDLELSAEEEELYEAALKVFQTGQAPLIFQVDAPFNIFDEDDI